MADGTFAVAMFVLGLFDMNRNYCGTEIGCLGKTEAQPRWAFSAGEVLERQATPAAEIYIRRDLGFNFGPFGNAAGLSVGEKGEVWMGIGQTWTYEWAGGPTYLQLHAMPGVYFPNGGFDLGGTVEFRSGIEIGVENRQGWRFAISYDHRSNAGIYRKNPGIETVQFRVSIPTK